MDYPDVLEVSSEGCANVQHPKFMGVYKIVPKSIFNGRPTWKHSSENLFLYYNQGWDIAKDYGDIFSAYISTNKNESFKIPETGWSFVNGTEYQFDSKLVVKPLDTE